MASDKETEPRFYFAYGSNISVTQMSRRCPTSTYYCLGLLHHYTWVIGERGYANIIYSPPSSSPPSPSLSSHQKGQEDVVYGLLYTLQEADEALLDRSEGVPHSYTKHLLDVDIVPPLASERRGDKKTVKALVYVDEVTRQPGICKEEYVARINRGIRDAAQRGMPRWYVENVLRKWVREEDAGEELWDPFLPGVAEGRV
jgi:hypothetical protein